MLDATTDRPGFIKQARVLFLQTKRLQCAYAEVGVSREIEEHLAAAARHLIELGVVHDFDIAIEESESEVRPHIESFLAGATSQERISVSEFISVLEKTADSGSVYDTVDVLLRVVDPSYLKEVIDLHLWKRSQAEPARTNPSTDP